MSPFKAVGASISAFFAALVVTIYTHMPDHKAPAPASAATPVIPAPAPKIETRATPHWKVVFDKVWHAPAVPVAPAVVPPPHPVSAAPIANVDAPLPPERPVVAQKAPRKAAKHHHRPKVAPTAVAAPEASQGLFSDLIAVVKAIF